MKRLPGLVFPINALPACQLVAEGINELSLNASIKSKAVSRYYARVDADLLFFFSDIAIQAEAMGAPTAFHSGTMPSVKGSASEIRCPSAKDVDRMRVNAEVVRSLRSDFSEKMISTMVYGPFTVAGQVAGEQTILRAVIDKPTEVRSLLEQTLAVAQDYASLLLDAGAHVLWVSDPLAALLPPDRFTEFAGDFLARLFDLQPHGPTALHICGDTTLIIQQMVETNVQAISFDQCMDLMAIEDHVAQGVTIVGNLEPVEILELAPEREVAEATKDLASLMGVKRNYALSTGCAAPSSAPIENVARFVQTGKEAFREIEPHREYLERLGDCVHRGDRDSVSHLIQKGRQLSMNPLLVVNSALMRGVRKGSARYETRQCFLPEILLMVDAFYEAYRYLEADLRLEQDRPVQVVLGTVQGDIHEIGKDLVRIIMETNGLKVLDLGADVSPEEFSDASRSTGAPILALSAFITSARKQLAKTIDLVSQSGENSAAVLVGGAAVNQHVAASVRADGYAKDAVGAVKLAMRILTERRHPVARQG